MTTTDKLAILLRGFVQVERRRAAQDPTSDCVWSLDWLTLMRRADEALKEHEEQSKMNEGFRQDIADSLGVSANEAHTLYHRWKSAVTTLSLAEWVEEQRKATYDVTVERTSTRRAVVQVKAHDRAHAELLALELARDTVFAEEVSDADFEVTHVEKI